MTDFRDVTAFIASREIYMHIQSSYYLVSSAQVEYTVSGTNICHAQKHGEDASRVYIGIELVEVPLQLSQLQL
jgi:hypothetical protein